MSKPDAGGNEYTFAAFQLIAYLKAKGWGWEDIAIAAREKGHAVRPEQIKAIVLGRKDRQ